MKNTFKNKLAGIGIEIVETGELFETRQKCADRLHVSPSLITMYFDGKVKSCAGYHLRYVEVDFDYPLTDDIVEYLYSLTGVECEWREHPYIHNVYVSNAGLVAKNKRGNVMTIQQHMQNSGYLVVSVDDYRTRNTKSSNRLVHRLVAETFVPNYHCYDVVNHIDGDKLNNRSSNLEWVTYSENLYHAFKNGLRNTESVTVVETCETFRSASECARAIGATVSGIHDCKVGRQSTHRGYHFIFGENPVTVASANRGVVIIDTWTGEEAYFDSVLEACQITRLDRKIILDALTNDELIVNGHYMFYYAGCEEVLLYGDDDNKLLSWIRIGLR